MIERDPGYAVLSSRDPGGTTRSSLADIVDETGESAVSIGNSDTFHCLTWALSPDHANAATGTSTFALLRGARSGDSDLTGAAIHEMLQERPVIAAANAMPPFAALQISEDAAVVVTDAIGARHVYVTSGDSWAASSTSPHVLGELRGSELDHEAVAVQSLLGWQLGRRTWYQGVSKLDSGTSATLAGGELVESRYLEPGRRTAPRGDEVQAAATFLREYMSTYLDEHPNPMLQLTGGQDSRILLSAIPPARRSQVTAMTLSVPGSEDVAIAADLARRSGMAHEVISIDDLGNLDPAEAFERSVAAARRLGCMADPLAMATLSFAEAKIDQGPRISGLGGEVARGFYYMGPTIKAPVTRLTSDLLAKWRMLTNQPVASEALEPGFAQWAKSFTLDEIHRSLTSTGLDWTAASDFFYLYERMQRWAGVTDTAVCFDREVINPMLDRRFLDIACRISPADKRSARFLGQLQVALDAEFAELPLDGRPSPRQLARTGLPSVAGSITLTGRKVVRKVRQRLSHQGRPAAGGEVLASKVVQHWRAHPELLDPAISSGLLRASWISAVLDGIQDVDPATVAFMTNLITATRVTTEPHSSALTEAS